MYHTYLIISNNKFIDNCTFLFHPEIYIQFPGQKYLLIANFQNESYDMNT